MDEYDEYDNYFSPLFIEEALPQTSQECASPPEVPGGIVAPGAARIAIEIERPTDDVLKASKSPEDIPNKTPYSQFRGKRGYLSVSDIVSPIWCELQYDYGLRQQRSQPVAARPKAFVTEKGKTIEVKQGIAVRNDKMLKVGTAVHKKLEKEVHAEKIKVEVVTWEEKWGLRLLDVLVRLKTLKESHVCRELYVWGFTRGQAVVGCIDELRLEPVQDVKDTPQSSTASSTTPSRKKEKKDNLSPSQPSITASFSGSSREEAPPPGILSTLGSSTLAPAHEIRIIDYKTRKGGSVPIHADTLPSRLQVMLYWRLLHDLLSPNQSPSPFMDFWPQIGVRPERAFSATFRTQMGDVVLANGLNLGFVASENLEGMLLPFRETLLELGIGDNISRSLRLVYRSRAEKKEGKTAKKTKTKPADSSLFHRAEGGKDNPIIVDKDDDTAELPTEPSEPTALEIPIHPFFMSKDTTDGKAPSGTGAAEPPVAATASSQKRKASYDTSSDSEPKLSAHIIGTKKFSYDGKMLDLHIDNVLWWWYGKRPPNGVELEQTSRCNSCEYRGGCEWREQKVLEIQTEMMKKIFKVPAKLEIGA